jgi:hypothetical protein
MAAKSLIFPQLSLRERHLCFVAIFYDLHGRNTPGQTEKCTLHIQSVPGGKANILGGYSVGHSKQKVYAYIYPIPNRSFGGTCGLSEAGGDMFLRNIS